MNSLIIMLYEFVLASWLFSVSYDWFHLILNTFLLCIMFCLVARVSMGRAIILSFSAHFFSFMCFSLLAIGLFVYHIAVEYIPSDLTEVAAAKDVLRACLQVGSIYALLQSFFIMILHIGSELSLRRLCIAIWLSNLLCGCLSYFCIVTIMRLFS